VPAVDQVPQYRSRWLLWHQMSMKLTRRTPVVETEGIADLSLKAWSRETLKREDWDFSTLADFPHEMLRVAWVYEADRELGSGNPPYLAAWEAQEMARRKAKLKAHLASHCFSDDRLFEDALLALLPEVPPDKAEMEMKAALQRTLDENQDMSPEETKAYCLREWDYRAARQRRLNAIAAAEVEARTTTWKPPAPKAPVPMLRSYHHHEFAKMQVPIYYTWVNGSASRHCTIHPLEIDWTLTETELVEAFRNWLREGDHLPFHSSYKRMGSESKVGKRKGAGWLAWLRDWQFIDSAKPALLARRAWRCWAVAVSRP
jgi:hypothetical protein